MDPFPSLYLLERILTSVDCVVLTSSSIDLRVVVLLTAFRDLDFFHRPACVRPVVRGSYVEIVLRRAWPKEIWVTLSYLCSIPMNHVFVCKKHTFGEVWVGWRTDIVPTILLCLKSFHFDFALLLLVSIQ